MNQVLQKIDALIVQRENADFLPNTLGGQWRTILRGSMPVVLFGAGSAGEYLCRALNIHGINVTCFCDNNQNLIGGNISGIPVISAGDLILNYRQCLVVISTSTGYAREIHEQLTNLGFPSDQIHTPPLEPLLYYTNLINQYSWSNEEFHTYADQLQQVYDLLADQKSKDIFVQRIAFFCSSFDYTSYKAFIEKYADLHSESDDRLFSAPRYDENYFYFNTDFFPLKEQEVFANVGALVGDCAIEFAEACKAKGLSYREIVNFEPDPNNFRQLQSNTNHLPNVRCLPYGLWSHRDRLRFDNPDPVNAGTPGSLSSNGAIEVNVASMDELIPETEVSLIKMDIEGAELQALIGAMNTIIRNKPKLAISLYHKKDDMFKIPLLIHNFCPGYRLYIRHHCTTFSETVLYAIQG